MGRIRILPRLTRQEKELLDSVERAALAFEVESPKHGGTTVRYFDGRNSVQADAIGQEVVFSMIKEIPTH